MQKPPKFTSQRTKTANLNSPPKGSETPEKPSTKAKSESDELADILADDAPYQTDSGGVHLDGFRAADLDFVSDVMDAVREVDEDGNEVDNGEPEAPPIDHLMTKDAFYGMIEMGFSVPAMIEPVFAPVAIQEAEAPQARLAFDAGYDLIEEYYPNFLKDRGFDKLGKIVLVGMFLAAKIKVTTMCFGELKRRDMEARRAVQQPQQSQSGEQQPANQDSAPKAGTGPMGWMDAEQGAA